MNDLFTDQRLIFLVMVFVAVLLLVYSMVVPAMGSERQAQKRLRKRIGQVVDDFDRPTAGSLLREKYLKELSPLERMLESLPGMAGLSRLIEQSGRIFPAYRLVLLSAILGGVTLLVVWTLTRQPLMALFAAAAVSFIPFIKIKQDRNKRLAKFEEQLPEALDSMARALQAGHPFNETLSLVAEEMDDPVAREFGLVFADINYGADVRSAFLSLLERVPSMSLMTLVTSVLVQRETGGNLAEILQKLAALVRGRFRFQRKVKTLSAEGRMSAWVLTMVPFALFAVISITTPDYLPVLTRDPMGIKMIIGAFVLMVLGIFWMRRIIRIEV